MAGIGVAAQVLEPSFASVLVAVAILTSFTTPILVDQAPRLLGLLERRMPAWLRASLSLYEGWLEQLRRRSLPRRWRRPLVVLALEAAGLVGLSIGASLARPWALAVLQAKLGVAELGATLILAIVEIVAWIPFVVGLSRAARRLARQVAEDLLPKVDAGRPDLANAPRRALIVALELALILAVTGPIAAFTAPFSAGPWTLLMLGAIVLASLSALRRGGHELDGHLRASAEVVIALIRAQADAGAARDHVDDPDHLVPGVGQIETISVGPGPLVGQTLAQLDLHSRAGVAVLAVVRAGTSIPRPPLDTIVAEGDTLALIGSEAGLTAARRLLLS